MGKMFLGIDVGTGSARAGIFDSRGHLVASAKRAIKIWHEAGDIVEQSSSDIWQACLHCIREAMEESGVEAAAIGGIGFDATCSLVVLDQTGEPLTVSPSGDLQRNVIVWMDHRALDQARRINKTGHEVLRYVGGAISPEMEMPKILWLKENLPETYRKAGHFFDLADYLTFRATGSLARSTCTVTCKWTYLAHEGRWSSDFFAKIGLSELAESDYRRIGSEIVNPGTPLASGLSKTAARETGLLPGTPVGASLIDAHAGGVGSLGAPDAQDAEPSSLLEGRVGYIMGTSACIMATTAKPSFVPGVWGPYDSAMFPGLWLNEGGQSAAGAAIDHLLRLHPAFTEASATANAEGKTILDWLERRIAARCESLSQAAFLAADLNVLPEFLGNRSPLADPDMRAVIAGLGFENDVESLERFFVAGICGLAYGLADVLDAMKKCGAAHDTIVISGGASRSALVRQILADVTGLKVALPATPEPVLLGAAILGACASGAFATLSGASAKMSALGQRSDKTSAEIAAFHRDKRTVYHALQEVERSSRNIMAPWNLKARKHG